MPEQNQNQLPPATSSLPVPGAWKMLLLLFVINLVTYIDRFILSAVLPKMQLDSSLFQPDDSLLQTKLGSLTSAFMVAYMCFSPLFAWAGDYIRRWWLLGIGVIAWSIASGLTGWAGSFLMLFLTRCFVGVGEAAYGPVAPAMLSDLYPVEKRGKMLSFFYLAIPCGSALGFVIGGQLANHFGWRRAFEVTFAGIFLGIVCFFMKEPTRGMQGVINGEKPKHVPWGKLLRHLKTNKSYVLGTLGMTLTTFILGGVATWVPTYVFQREAKFAITQNLIDKLSSDPEYINSDGKRIIPEQITLKLAQKISNETSFSYAEFKNYLKENFGDKDVKQYGEKLFDAATKEDSLTVGKIATYFGAITVVGGLLATISGGIFGDWLRKKQVRGAFFHAAGWSTIFAWPLFVLLMFCPFPAAWFVLFVTIFLLFFNTGPANTVLANVTHSSIRASAFAVNIFVIHAFGDAISPMLIGFIADFSSLQFAFLICSVFILFGGGVWVYASKYLDEDTMKAESSVTIT